MDCVYDVCFRPWAAQKKLYNYWLTFTRTDGGVDHAWGRLGYLVQLSWGALLRDTSVPGNEPATCHLRAREREIENGYRGIQGNEGANFFFWYSWYLVTYNDTGWLTNQVQKIVHQKLWLHPKLFPKPQSGKLVINHRHLIDPCFICSVKGRS